MNMQMNLHHLLHPHCLLHLFLLLWHHHRRLPVLKCHQSNQNTDLRRHHYLALKCQFL
jgi:hypothetical protein